MKTKRVLLASALMLFSVGYTAFAQSGAAMTEADVTKKLEAAGYTNIHGIELEGRHFDADATTKDGKKVHLHVDAKTGAVSPVANESDEDEKGEK
jgi:hypothetical protein